MNKFSSFIQTTIHFFQKDIWQISEEQLPKLNKFCLKCCRVCVLTVKFFIKNMCRLRASALTLLTLLSIVPVAALIFGIAKGYGFELILKERLIKSMPGQEKVAEWIFQFAESALANSSGGVVAGVGVCMLIWTALKLFGSIEESFNTIWGIRKGRNIFRRFTDYLTLLMIFPLLMIMIATCNTLLATQISFFSSQLHIEILTASTISSIYPKIVTFLISWFTFCFIYAFIPNTRVKLSSAMISGFFIGLFYLVIQYVYLFLQTRLTSYNTIYGSFAALPFFLIWLQISWTLILFGAQFCFAIENLEIYEPGRDELINSAHYESLIALRVMHDICVNFENDGKTTSEKELIQKLKIPEFTLHNVLYKLMECNLIHQVVSIREQNANLYQIALPVEKITSAFILRRLNECGSSGYQKFDGYREYEECVNSLWNAMENSEENKKQVTCGR